MLHYGSMSDASFVFFVELLELQTYKNVPVCSLKASYFENFFEDHRKLNLTQSLFKQHCKLQAFNSTIKIFVKDVSL